MAVRDFKQISEMARAGGKRKTIGVLNACDVNVLEAVESARDIADAILIGDPQEIREKLDEAGIRGDYRIEAPGEDGDVVAKAAELVHAGEIHMLMKGKISTGDMFKGIFKKETGLRGGQLMSHLVFKEIPGARKIIGITDGALSIQPSCEDKKHILSNALDFMHGIGYECPNVAVLCAIEKVNPKMQETVDAAELKEAWKRGEFPGCNLEGPISYDIAVSAEVAARKGFDCAWCGDFDLLLVPSVVVGNILGKCLVYTAKAKMGSIVLGCKVPVIMGSRGASAEDKYNSIALGVVYANLRKE